MTSNQIEYWKSQIQREYNVGYLTETNRHNLETEAVARIEAATHQRQAAAQELTAQASWLNSTANMMATENSIFWSADYVKQGYMNAQANQTSAYASYLNALTNQQKYQLEYDKWWLDPTASVGRYAAQAVNQVGQPIVDWAVDEASKVSKHIVGIAQDGYEVLSGHASGGGGGHAY
jgi:hypothetical protein